MPAASHRDDAAGAARTNLPEPLTSFVGRERELVEIKRLLPTTRLLTLVGTGGIGKTRLALQLAAEVMDAYRDGVWFVDLAPIVAADLVPSAVAQVLGRRETAGKHSVRDALRPDQGTRSSCCCSTIASICSTAARGSPTHAARRAEPTIIATSREPLQIPGEQIYPLPHAVAARSAGERGSMAGSEAVQLFVERAQRQQPGFD